MSPELQNAADLEAELGAGVMPDGGTSLVLPTAAQMEADLGTEMNIIQSGEELDFNCQYHHTDLVLQSRDKLYYARYHKRGINRIKAGWTPPKSEITHVTKISPLIFPLYDKVLFGQAFASPPADCYVKRPSLLNYSGPEGDETAKLMLTEARIHQALADKPHKHLGSYLGCVVADNRVTALCLPKYCSSLPDRMETMVDDEGDPTFDVATFDVDACIEGLCAAVAHLHSLGLCHNDVNPENVMFTEDDTVILLDFDASLPVGEKLVKMGTIGWSDGFPTHSKFSNDLTGLDKLEHYIRTGKRPELDWEVLRNWPEDAKAEV